MTITATHIGTSTVQITNYWDPESGATTLHGFDKFAATIADAITGTADGTAGILSGITFTSESGTTFQASTGWTLADSFWGYNTKTTSRSNSPIYTQVFKSLCADGNSIKNLILRYNTITEELLTTTCEKYEVATRTITNEAFTFFDCAPINYNLTYSDIIIMVNPRYLILHSYVATEPTLWAGVVESNREDFFDVATAGYPDTVGSTGYPCWGWISSVSWSLGCIAVDGRVFANGTTATESGPLWSMPRTRNGSTGANAAVSYSCDLGVESYPSVLGTASSLTGMNRYIENNTRFKTTGWSVNKLLMPIKPTHNFNGAAVTNYGQIYGLKVLSALGYNMNQVDIPVDSDLNANPTGTNRRHWLLNTHAKIPTAAAYRDMGLWTTDFYNVNNSKAMRHISIGSAIYVIAGTAKGTGVLYKINRFTRTVTAVPGTFNSSLVDLIYDGERYLYISRNGAANSLIRLDITDNSTSAINAVSLGVLAINGSTVTAAEYTIPATTFTNYRFTRQSFAGTVSPLTALTSSTITGATANTFITKYLTDFDGATLYYTSGTNSTIYKIPEIGGAASTSGITFSSTDATDMTLLDGKTLWTIGCLSNSTSGLKVAFNYPSTATTTFTGSPSKVVTALNRGSAGIFKYQGVLIMETPDATNNVGMFAMGMPGTSNLYNGITALTNITVTNKVFTPITSGVADALSILAKMYGSELMATTDLGLNIYQNLNGYNSIGSYVTNASNKLAQVAIPA